MTQDTFLYLVAAAAVPTIGWAITFNFLIRDIRRDTQLLVKMHRDPDKYGFGTEQTNDNVRQAHEETQECVKAMTRAVSSLTHYIKWLAEEQTGKVPPPPVHPD